MGTVNFTEQCTPFSSLQNVENTNINSSRSGTQTIATISINGTLYPINVDVSTITSVYDVINAINADPVVGALVTASAEYDATTGDGKIVVVGKSDSVANVVIVDDSTFILNWLYTDADANGNLAYISPIKVQTTTNGVVGGFLNQLEPKPAVPALDQVYIPLHTEIVSDFPVISSQYWVENVNNIDSNEVVSGVATGTHQTTNDSVGYFISHAGRCVTVTAKYLGGEQTNSLVSSYGTGGILHLPPMPDTWLTPESDPYTYSASIAVSPVDGSVYVKIVSEANVTIEGNSTHRSSTVITKYDRTLTTHEWDRLVSYSDVPNPMFGRTIPTMDRSDGGIAIDSSGNIVIAIALVDFYEDAYGGGVFVEPATLVMKFQPNGDELWRLPIPHTKSVDTYWQQPWGNVRISPTQDVDWRYTPCLCIQPQTNNIFVSVGTSVLWIEPNSNIAAGLGIGHTSLQQGDVICDIAVGGMNLYVMLNNHTSPYDYYGLPAATLIKFNLNQDFFNSMVFTHDAWSIGRASERYTAGASGPNPFSQPTKIVVDSTDDNIVYGVTALRLHGPDYYTGYAAGDITLFSIDTSSDVVWASDFKQSVLNGAHWPRAVNFTEDAWTGQASIALSAQGVVVTLPLLSTADVDPGEAAEEAKQGTQMYISKSSATSYAGSELAYTDVTADMDFTSGHIIDVVPLIVPYGLTSLMSLTTVISTTSSNVVGTEQSIFTTTPLPPYEATVTPSLHVQNIAAIGELQLLGLFTAPTSLRGSATDQKGMIRIGNDGIYCCTADYTTGTPNIWSYSPFAGGASIRDIPPGYNPNNGRIVGGPADVVGDVYAFNSGMALVCVGEYNGTSEIWKAIGPTYSTSDFTVNRSINYNTGIDARYWPTGRYLTQYDVNLQVIPKTTSTPSYIYNQSLIYLYLSSNPSGTVYTIFGTSASTLQMMGYAWDYVNGWYINIVNESLQKVRIIPPSSGVIAGGVTTLRPNESMTLQFIGYYGGNYQFAVVSRSANKPYVMQANSNTSPTLDFELSNQFHITLTNSYSVPALARPYSSWVNGDVVEIFIKQQVGFSYTTTWDTSYKFAGGTAPTAPTSGNMHVVRAVRMPSGYFACTVTLNVPA